MTAASSSASQVNISTLEANTTLDDAYYFAFLCVLQIILLLCDNI